VVVETEVEEAEEIEEEEVLEDGVVEEERITIEKYTRMRSLFMRRMVINLWHLLPLQRRNLQQFWDIYQILSK